MISAKVPDYLSLPIRNHAVIMSDSPKDFAIIAVIESTFGAAEQRCTAPRIAVLVGSACEWIEAIIARASRLVVGDGRGTKVDL